MEAHENALREQACRVVQAAFRQWNLRRKSAPTRRSSVPNSTTGPKHVGAPVAWEDAEAEDDSDADTVGASSDGGSTLCSSDDEETDSSATEASSASSGSEDIEDPSDSSDSDPDDGWSGANRVRSTDAVTGQVSTRRLSQDVGVHKKTREGRAKRHVMAVRAVCSLRSKRRERDRIAMASAVAAAKRGGSSGFSSEDVKRWAVKRQMAIANARRIRAHRDSPQSSPRVSTVHTFPGVASPSERPNSAPARQSGASAYHAHRASIEMIAAYYQVPAHQLLQSQRRRAGVVSQWRRRIETSRKSPLPQQRPFSAGAVPPQRPPPAQHRRSSNAQRRAALSRSHGEPHSPGFGAREAAKPPTRDQSGADVAGTDTAARDSQSVSDKFITGTAHGPPISRSAQAAASVPFHHEIELAHQHRLMQRHKQQQRQSHSSQATPTTTVHVHSGTGSARSTSAAAPRPTTTRASPVRPSSKPPRPVSASRRRRQQRTTAVTPPRRASRTPGVAARGQGIRISPQPSKLFSPLKVRPRPPRADAPPPRPHSQLSVVPTSPVATGQASPVGSLHKKPDLNLMAVPRRTMPGVQSPTSPPSPVRPVVTTNGARRSSSERGRANGGTTSQQPPRPEVRRSLSGRRSSKRPARRLSFGGGGPSVQSRRARSSSEAGGGSRGGCPPPATIEYYALPPASIGTEAAPVAGLAGAKKKRQEGELPAHGDVVPSLQRDQQHFLHDSEGSDAEGWMQMCMGCGFECEVGPKACKQCGEAFSV